MLIRLLILFLVIWFLIWLLKKQLFSQSEQKPRLKSGEDMLVCEVCGTHVPESEGVRRNGKFYCSQQHAEQASSGE